MTKVCPIFSLSNHMSEQMGTNCGAVQCQRKECMFFNASQDICTISGQSPEFELETNDKEDKTINLCNTCSKCFANCDNGEEGKDFFFGLGLGYDNVYKCKAYEPPVAPVEDKPKFKVGEKVKAVGDYHVGEVGTATPQDFFDKLDDEFHFTLDPCSTHENAKCAKHYTVEDNGLVQDWSGETVFCNPPYGRELSDWIEKCYAESRHATVVMLIPARTDTKAFYEYIYGKSELRFIKGRLKFGDSKNSAPYPSLLAIYTSTEATL